MSWLVKMSEDNIPYFNEDVYFATKEEANIYLRDALVSSQVVLGMEESDHAPTRFYESVQNKLKEEANAQQERQARADNCNTFADFCGYIKDFILEEMPELYKDGVVKLKTDPDCPTSKLLIIKPHKDALLAPRVSLEQYFVEYMYNKEYISLDTQMLGIAGVYYDESKNINAKAEDLDEYILSKPEIETYNKFEQIIKACVTGYFQQEAELDRTSDYNTKISIKADNGKKATLDIGKEYIYYLHHLNYIYSGDNVIEQLNEKLEQIKKAPNKSTVR